MTLVATGWVSVRVVQLERQRIEEAQHAKVEENVSLALWRIDSLVAPLIAMENAQSFQEYGSLSQNHQPPNEKEEDPKLDNRYFTVELFTDGDDGSVQRVRPTGDDVPTALRQPAEVSRLVAELPKPTIQLSEPAMLQFEAVALDNLQNELPQNAKPSRGGKVAVSKGSTRSGLEFQARQSTLNRAMSNFSQQMQAFPNQQATSNAPVPQQAPAPPNALRNIPDSPPVPLSQAYQPAMPGSFPSPAPVNSPTTPIEPQSNASDMPQMAPTDLSQQTQAMVPQFPNAPESNDAWAPMRPVCIGDQLLLLRRVRFGGRSFLQGCLLDWPRLARFLEKEFSDLLPDAKLVLDDKQNALGRMLASLPVRLEPGPLPPSDMASVHATLTPVLVSVAIAFGCVLLSIGAFAVLLRGMIRLGQRRSEFVTAVTHELRTPLTTFRMYSEMLTEGMVPPESQKSYLQTLESEADRLTHLVENVLSSARLERGRHSDRIETLSLNELIAPIASRLVKRCQRAEMRLDVQMDHPSGGTTIATNPLAIEQIIWNLVDNACKYATSAEDRMILMVCEARNGAGVAITVSDQGPGLAREVRRRLFSGFSKTATEAAQSAPGVGLGLALSRRLARDLGGDLEFVQTKRGACFKLTFAAKQ